MAPPRHLTSFTSPSIMFVLSQTDFASRLSCWGKQMEHFIWQHSLQMCTPSRSSHCGERITMNSSGPLWFHSLCPRSSLTDDGPQCWLPEICSCDKNHTCFKFRNSKNSLGLKVNIKRDKAVLREHKEKGWRHTFVKTKRQPLSIWRLHWSKSL